MAENRGRMLAELRRSNAAGIHDHVPTRTQVKQYAIKEELMSLTDEYYGVVENEEYVPEGDHDWLNDPAYEPTDAELEALEDELELQDPLDDEDAYPTIYDEEE